MIKLSKIFIIFLIALVSCDRRSDDWLIKEVGTLLWVNTSMPDSLVKMGVKETLENSSIIVAQISWSPNDLNFERNVKWYHTLAKESGKSFMLNIDWLENNRSGTRGNWSFEDEKVREIFIKDIKRLIDLYQPNYLTLGIEVNYYALTSPIGYKGFVRTFNELKKNIKEKDPNIKIGLSFQLELLYGIHKGWKQVRTLEPLNAVVENLDYVGISTYPDVLIPSANKRFYSVNYIDSLAVIYKKAIGISETGISSTKYSNIERVNYIKTVYKKAEDLNLKFIIWGSIIDDTRQFQWKNKLGLIYSDGVTKAEFNIWKQENNKILKN